MPVHGKDFLSAIIVEPLRAQIWHANFMLCGYWRTMANFGGFVMRNCYANAPIPYDKREAEGVRFELTRPFGLPVFKTGAINHSATPPTH
jgi:hypothetical protein